MIELKVAKGDEGQRLNKYLMKYLNKAPSSFIYKMLRKKNIVLNGKKANGNEIISSEDSVKLFLSDETIASFREEKNKQTSRYVDKSIDSNLNCDIKVLYENGDILVLHKPVGILSQKASESDYSINDFVIEYYNMLKEKNNMLNNYFIPSICNRLDRNTSGIIVAGLSQYGSQFLSKAMKERSADKYYFTIVCGNFSKKMHIISYISKDEKNNISKVISQNDYIELTEKLQQNYTKIETLFEPLSFNNRFTLLKIKLITGKSHQIRAHLKQMGYPIIGDKKYGDELVNRYVRDKYRLNNQLLHSGILVLDNKEYKDPLPKLFKKICIDEGLDTNLV
ncbi:MAG: RluA family pseudouridine synthase [Lachnospiraceae bacterium]|nr:RluA family pseudouridine synthase [Lachnospiraceae bacterium]